jgi:DNA-binding LacI/PurR family transcriptional regulator
MVTHRKYKLENALSRLRSEINSGKYKPGVFLPAERKLSEILDISRGTLRTLLKELQKENLIRINPGKGAYVIDSNERKGLKRFLVNFPSINRHNRASEAVGALLGICSEASKIHAEATISFGEGIKTSTQIIEEYSSDDIQGVIFFERVNFNKDIAPLEKAGVPYVVINLEKDMPVVSSKMDFRAVGRQAGKYLINAGKKSFAILSGPQQNFIYNEMLAGFRGALAEEELFIDKSKIIEMESNAEQARLKTIELLGKHRDIDAVFSMRDARANGFFTACRELNIKIPDDISIVSYDNITWPSAKDAGLSSIKEQVEEMGEAAVDMLAKWVETGEKPENRIFQGVLISRTSVTG